MSVNEIYDVFQQVLMYVCIVSMIALAIGVALYKARFFIDNVYHKWLHLDGFGKVVSAVCVSVAVLYGGAKNAGYNRVQHDGGDDGLQLCGVYTMLTNEVVSASVTNTLTGVQVLFTGTGITTSTPVSVRMSETNEWITLEKQNASAMYDLSTNNVTFSVVGDYTKYPYWWVGDDKPAIHIETSGIEITYFLAGSQSVDIAWKCDDTRAKSFIVQYRNGTEGDWITLTETTAKNIVVSGFFINRTTQWRITSTITEGD